MRHGQERADLDRAHDEELRTFYSFWEKRMNEFESEGNRMTSDLAAKHESEQQNLRNTLERELPYKVKESSEFLNLKKMEEHMAKQKL